MNTQELITQWHAYLLTEKRVARNTYLSYVADLNQFIAYLEQLQLTIATTTPEHLTAYVHHLHARGLKPTTMARKIVALKTCFEYLQKRLSIPNVADHLEIPKLESRLPKYLTEQEVAALLLTCQEDTTPLGKRNNLIINLLYATGLRISELANLLVSNLRIEDQLLTVFGKGSKERMVPLPEQTVVLLTDYITHTLPTFLRRPVQDGNEPLFPVLYAKTIKPITRQALWGIIKKLCVQAAITKKVSPHQIRHSLATHLLKNGFDLRSIQVLLGHQQLASVEIYTHVEKSHIRTVYDKKHPRS